MAIKCVGGSFMDAMKDMISMAISLHVIFIVITAVLAIFSYIFINSDRDFRGFSNRVESISLQYYFMLAGLFFTGLVVFGATGLEITWQVVMMISALIWIIFSSVKLHMLFKMTRQRDIESQKRFKVYAKRKYLIDIVLILLISVIMYAISL